MSQDFNIFDQVEVWLSCDIHKISSFDFIMLAEAWLLFWTILKKKFLTLKKL